jgi:hypothetical protein
VNEKALEMKDECEECGGSLAAEDETYICVFECTFRGDSPESMAHQRPGCGGKPAHLESGR